MDIIPDKKQGVKTSSENFTGFRFLVELCQELMSFLESGMVLSQDYSSLSLPSSFSGLVFSFKWIEPSNNNNYYSF